MMLPNNCLHEVKIEDVVVILKWLKPPITALHCSIDIIFVFTVKIAISQTRQGPRFCYQLESLLYFKQQERSLLSPVKRSTVLQRVVLKTCKV